MEPTDEPSSDASRMMGPQMTGPEPRRRLGVHDDGGVLPVSPVGDRDEAWGERHWERADDAQWLRDQRPPHWQ